jgi:hypothetical protein
MLSLSKHDKTEFINAQLFVSNIKQGFLQFSNSLLLTPSRHASTGSVWMYSLLLQPSAYNPPAFL